MPTTSVCCPCSPLVLDELQSTLILRSPRVDVEFETNLVSVDLEHSKKDVHLLRTVTDCLLLHLLMLISYRSSLGLGDEIE